MKRAGQSSVRFSYDKFSWNTAKSCGTWEHVELVRKALSLLHKFHVGHPSTRCFLFILIFDLLQCLDDLLLSETLIGRSRPTFASISAWTFRCTSGYWAMKMKLHNSEDVVVSVPAANKSSTDTNNWSSVILNKKKRLFFSTVFQMVVWLVDFTQWDSQKHWRKYVHYYMNKYETFSAKKALYLRNLVCFHTWWLGRPVPWETRWYNRPLSPPAALATTSSPYARWPRPWRTSSPLRCFWQIPPIFVWRARRGTFSRRETYWRGTDRWTVWRFHRIGYTAGWIFYRCARSACRTRWRKSRWTRWGSNARADWRAAASFRRFWSPRPPRLGWRPPANFSPFRDSAGWSGRNDVAPSTVRPLTGEGLKAWSRTQ